MHKIIPAIRVFHAEGKCSQHIGQSSRIHSMGRKHGFCSVPIKLHHAPFKLQVVSSVSQRRVTSSFCPSLALRNNILHFFWELTSGKLFCLLPNRCTYVTIGCNFPLFLPVASTGVLLFLCSANSGHLKQPIYISSLFGICFLEMFTARPQLQSVTHTSNTLSVYCGLSVCVRYICWIGGKELWFLCRIGRRGLGMLFLPPTLSSQTVMDPEMAKSSCSSDHKALSRALNCSCAERELSPPRPTLGTRRWGRKRRQEEEGQEEGGGGGTKWQDGWQSVGRSWHSHLREWAAGGGEVSLIHSSSERRSSETGSPDQRAVYFERRM